MDDEQLLQWVADCEGNMNQNELKAAIAALIFRVLELERRLKERKG